MKILHIVPSYLPATRYGGPIYSVHGLCKALVLNGHEVSVFTTNVDGPNNSDVPLGQGVDVDGVKVWYFQSRILRRLFWAPGLSRVLRKKMGSFDILHLHSVFLWPTWVAARCAYKAGVPYIVAPRGMLVRDLIKRKSRFIKSAWIRFIERRTLSQASGIHITAKVEQEGIQEFGFDLPRIFYVPNGIENIDTSNVSPEISLPEYPYVLFLGRLNWKKGLDRLLKAWKHVPETQLVIAGNDEEGYISDLIKIADDEGVLDRVSFIGPVSGEEKWTWLENASIFVLPSYSENFGIAVLEAMAVGCPVVVTPEVGLSDTVSKEDCGLVVSGEPGELATAITGLLQDKGTCEAMGRRGKIVAESQFNWESIGREMAGVYEDILRDCRKSTGTDLS